MNTVTKIHLLVEDEKKQHIGENNGNLEDQQAGGNNSPDNNDGKQGNQKPPLPDKPDKPIPPQIKPQGQNQVDKPNGSADDKNQQGPKDGDVYPPKENKTNNPQDQPEIVDLNQPMENENAPEQLPDVYPQDEPRPTPYTGAVNIGIPQRDFVS